MLPLPMLLVLINTHTNSLSDYLDTKRNAFPRFFFISDDELLSVLGSADPMSIQVYTHITQLCNAML
jgi:dynein heavy chain, axonemal